MNPEKINIPRLRFPEFSEEWNKKKLEYFFSFKNGVNASKGNYGRGYKFINVLDIIENNYITYEKIIDRVEISEEIFNKNIVEYGDILFQRSSETREEVGQSNVYLDKVRTATFGGFVIRGKMIKEYHPSFMNYLLKTSNSRKEITTKSGGSTRYNVGQETLKKVEIFTTSLLEQQNIATFLTAVDKKLSQLQNKKALLQDYKKGVMQQIFSQELRFKYDDGNDYPDWEEKKLGEICKIRTGKLDANAMVNNGAYRFYTCAKNYFQIDNYAFETEALLISGNGANVGYIHYYKGKFNAYQRTYVLDGFKENIHYSKCYLDKNLHERISNEKKEGNTPYIVLSTLKDMVVKLPTEKEQIKIANFLSAIDKKIELVNTQLVNTQQFKKGLLQQMFV